VVTNQKGCKDSLLFSDTIMVQASPDVGYVTNLEEGVPLCFPITIVFTDTTNDQNFDYRIWDLGTGGVVPDQSVGHTYDLPAVYTTSLKVFTDNGCSGFYEQDFVVEGPLADFSLSDPAICSYDSVMLKIIDSTDVAYFSWDLGNGVDSANISPLVYQYPDVEMTENVFIQLVLWSNDSTCSSITDHTLMVNHTIADFDRNAETIMTDSIHCFGIPDVFNNQSSVDANSFLWEFGDGALSTQKSPTYIYPTAGEYIVKLKAKNNVLGCIDSLKKPMMIYPEMVVEATAPMVCSYDTLYLNASGGVSYLWSPQNAVNDPTISNPYLLLNDTQTLEVEITDINDCSQKLTVEARFLVEPPPPAWTDTSISLGSTLNFNYPLEDYHNYYWILEDGEECNNCGMEFVPGATGNYLLVISDNLGCFVDTFTYHVTLLHEVEVISPNIFSPNGDGINDTFILDIERASELGYGFSIWNRWGKLIWTTDNLFESWDGTSNQGGSNKKASEGVYFWAVDVHNLIGEPRSYKGYITLVR
jgi:gliding motility-associated-like protein